MSRIPTPGTIADAPEAARPLLEAVNSQLGIVPNLFRIVSNSPAALEGYLGLNGALGKGKLSSATRERIALAIAEINGCNYCLAAHTYLGSNLAKLDAAEIVANRHGGSNDAKADVAVRFAAKIARERGGVSAADVEAVRAAGYGDAEIVEIVAHVALNTLTNYVNDALGTVIDFPEVERLAAQLGCLCASGVEGVHVSGKSTAGNFIRTQDLRRIVVLVVSSVIDCSTASSHVSGAKFMGLLDALKRCAPSLLAMPARAPSDETPRYLPSPEYTQSGTSLMPGRGSVTSKKRSS